MHETLEACLTWLDHMATWPDGWNGYDALAPKKACIEKAKTWLTALYALVGKEAWHAPTFVTGTGDGGVDIEWTCDTRKAGVGIYEDEMWCLKVWMGEQKGVEMEESEAQLPAFLETWAWLYPRVEK